MQRHKTRGGLQGHLRAKALALSQAHLTSRIIHSSGLHRFLLLKPLKAFSTPVCILKGTS